MVKCNHSVIQLNLQVKLYDGVVTFNHTISIADKTFGHADSHHQADMILFNQHLSYVRVSAEC